MRKSETESQTVKKLGNCVIWWSAQVKLEKYTYIRFELEPWSCGDRLSNNHAHKKCEHHIIDWPKYRVMLAKDYGLSLKWQK